MANFKLIKSRDYADDVAAEAKKARLRVYALTLIITDDASTRAAIKSIHQAVRRGVETNIAIDAFTYSELGGLFSPLKKRKEASRIATDMLSKLSDAGAKTHILNDKPKLNPLSGVTHIKWLVIDNIVYCFGGTNLYEKGARSLDYMLKTKNKNLADALVKEQKEIILRDQEDCQYEGLSLDISGGKLLIDSGKKGDSLIYQRACELARQSKEILFVSQYCPTGELASLLKNIPSKIYFNPPKITKKETRLFIKASMLKTGLKTLYEKDVYIHAKFIIFSLKTGQKVTITGSHNFSYSGVTQGTKEVALESTDHGVIKQLEEFFQNSIA